MTGTSMDGVDAVAVAIEGRGLNMSASYLGMASSDLGTLESLLRKLATQGGTKDELASAALRLGSITSDTISQLPVASIDAIALHGQTILHDPPTSIQLINPQPIIDTFSCTVLTDPRQADLQLGGQGAPITPLADWIMFRSQTERTSIVNLGGFCNVTLLPADCAPNQIHGFDVCCCNLVLNAIARERLGTEFDVGGAVASQGQVDDKVCESLFEYLSEQSKANRSLGSNDDIGTYALLIGSQLSTEDLLASATKAIGNCISGSLDTGRILLAGGGVHNTQLIASIPNCGTTEVQGVPTQAREAMAMAILGALAEDGVSITLPHITKRAETTDVVGWVQASP
jgi:anhydro-N-acetylmuramic acid kinase